MADPSPPSWARGRILAHLVLSTIGQILLIYPGERLAGAALLALNGAYFVFFFRNVVMAGRLERLLLDSGDLDGDEPDDSVPMGTSYPWIFLAFPVVYIGAAVDIELALLAAWLVWVDLARLVVQFMLVAVVHANLRHKLKMLTDPEYLAKVVEQARARTSEGGDPGS